MAGKIQLNEEKNSIASLLKDPTVITLILTALFYIVIATYYINYFDRLSLPFYTLNLPLTFYLNSGYYILIIFLIIFMLIVTIYSFFASIIEDGGHKRERVEIVEEEGHESEKIEIVDEDHEKGNKWQTFGFIMFMGLYIFLFINIPQFPQSLKQHMIESQPIGFFYFIYFQFSNTLNIISVFLGYYLSNILKFIIIVALGNLMVPIFSSLIVEPIHSRRVAIKNLMVSISDLWIILPISIVLLIFLTIVIPSMMGYYAAEDLINGKCDHLTINLTLTEKNSTLNNKEFLLVTQCNGNYYLIEESNMTVKNNSAHLYIIPENQIRTAILKKNIV